MHWPAPMNPSGPGADKAWNWLDTWKAMEDLYKAHPEKVKAIGVSNVSVELLEKLFEVATVIPATNQIELHPCVIRACCGVTAPKREMRSVGAGPT